MKVEALGNYVRIDVVPADKEIANLLCEAWVFIAPELEKAIREAFVSAEETRRPTGWIEVRLRAPYLVSSSPTGVWLSGALSMIEFDQNALFDLRKVLEQAWIKICSKPEEFDPGKSEYFRQTRAPILVERLRQIPCTVVVNRHELWVSRVSPD